MKRILLCLLFALPMLLSERAIAQSCPAGTESGGLTVTLIGSGTGIPLGAPAINGTTAVCLAAASPTITFTGTGGTKPYSFTYRVTDPNGNSSTALIATVGESATATLAASTSIVGTYTYTLIQVASSGSGACTMAPGSSNSSVTIQIYPKPIGVASAHTVCSDQAFSFNPQNNVNDDNGGNDVLSTFAWKVTNISGTVTGVAVDQTGMNDVVGNINNVGSTDAVITYEVTPTSVTGLCVGLAFNIVVTVKPEPVGANATLATCSDVILNRNLQGDITNGLTGVSFSWVAASNANVTGESTEAQSGIMDDNLTNVTNIDQTVVYTVTPTGANGCVGNTFTVTVTVKPEPVGANAILATCSDVTLNRNLQGDITNGMAGVSFSWVAASNDNVTGESITAQSGILDDNLTNVTNIDQEVVYTVTPTGANGCVGNTFTVTVTVKPEPVGANATFATCSDITLNRDLQGDITNGMAGVSFSWVAASNDNVTGESSTVQSGILDDNLTNTTNVDQIVVYTVTPTGANGCVGNTFTVTVTVKPEPVGANAVLATCSDVVLSRDLQGDITNGMSSVTFSWVAASNANVSGESTVAQSGILDDNLTNVTNIDQTVVYTVTPTGANGCVGNTFTVTVTVKPEPVGANAAFATCSDVILSRDLQGDITNGMTGVSFSWVAAPNANVSGESTTAQSGTLDDNLTNVTNIDQTVVYTVTPTGANGCVGNTFTVTVTVKPEPVGADATLATCSDVILNRNLQGDITNGMTGVSFSWIAASNASVTGESTTAQDGILDDNLTNVTSVDQTVVYTVTPTGANGCVGNTFTVTVTVKPEPVGANASLTTCSDVILSRNLQGDITNGMTGVSFSWVAASNDNVTGESTSAQTGILDDNLTNVTGVNQSVVYTVTPTGANGCEGNTFTVTVTVKPEAVGIATPATQTVCSDVSITDIVLSTSNNLSGTTYAWTRDNTTNVTGLESGSGNITGALNNITGVAQTVTFTITPTTAGCTGDPFTATVVISPEPVGVALPTTQTVCSDVAISDIVLSTSNNLSGTTYAWTRDNTTNVTGLASGTGNITGAMNNVTSTAQTVTFTIIPTIGGCVGNPFTATVIVNPEPVGVAAPATQTVCSDGAITDIVLSTSNNLSTTTYAWTRNNTTNVTGLASGSGDITGTMNNVTGVAQTVTFTITPTTGGCVGNAFTATVIVNPEPVGANAIFTTCSDVILNRDLQGDITNGMTGVTFSWVAASNANVTGESMSAQTGSLDDNLTNVTGVDQTVVYTVTPTGANSCVGNPFTVTVTVKPEPVGVATPASQEVCSDVAFTTIALSTSNSLSGTTYAWTRDNTVNVTGVAASGAGDISGTFNNVTGATQTVTFTITPTTNGCVGNPFTATVTVNPEPVGVATPSAQSVCSDVAFTTIALSTSNSLSGTTYAWTRDNTTNVTGVAASGAGNIAGTFTNVTGTAQTVTFTITPTTNGCVGNPFTSTVTVTPEPVGVATPSTQSVCSDVAFTTIVLSTSNSLSGTTYAWTRDNTTNVTGVAASGAGDIAGTFTNVTGTAQTVTFTITPTTNGCVGNPFTATIIVNPEPVGANATFTTCSDVTLSRNLQGDITNGMTGVTFSWVAASNGNVTGESTVAQSGILDDNLTNVSSADQTVVYTVTPTGANGCVGNTFTVSVTVIPEPVVAAQTTEVCSGVALSGFTLGNDADAPVVTSWNITDISVSTGLTPGGTNTATGITSVAGELNGDTWTNTTANPLTVVYTIIPVAGGCNGDAFSVTVTVNPGVIAATCITHDNCQSGNGNIQVNVTQGTPPYTVENKGTYTITTNTGNSGAPVFTLPTDVNNVRTLTSPAPNTNPTAVTYPNLPGNATYKIKVTDAKGCTIGSLQ